MVSGGTATPKEMFSKPLRVRFIAEPRLSEYLKVRGIPVSRKPTHMGLQGATLRSYVQRFLGLG